MAPNIPAAIAHIAYEKQPPASPFYIDLKKRVYEYIAKRSAYDVQWTLLEPGRASTSLFHSGWPGEGLKGGAGSFCVSWEVSTGRHRKAESASRKAFLGGTEALGGPP